MVVGAAFGGVVQALVQDIITPLLGAYGGCRTFGASTLLIGDFLNALLSFLLIALVSTSAIFGTVIDAVAPGVQRSRRGVS